MYYSMIFNIEAKGIPWPKTVATDYHAQLGLADKGLYYQTVSCIMVLWMRNHTLQWQDLVQYTPKKGLL